MALGRAWTLLGSRKNSKPEKYSKNRTVPQRPAIRPAERSEDGVHALLGVFVAPDLLAEK